MSYLEKEFMPYLYNVGGVINPGSYVYYLRIIEKLLDVDIDKEYERDECRSLYNTLQDLRKKPEKLGKNEVFFRQCASRLNKYIGFKKWKENSVDDTITAIEIKRDSLGDADVQITRYWLYSPVEGAWEKQYEKGIMTLNCIELGDLRNFNVAAKLN